MTKIGGLPLVVKVNQLDWFACLPGTGLSSHHHLAMSDHRSLLLHSCMASPLGVFIQQHGTTFYRDNHVCTLFTRPAPGSGLECSDAFVSG